MLLSVFLLYLNLAVFAKEISIHSIMKIKIVQADNYKLQAVKIIRFLTTSDLKSAKEAVDNKLEIEMDNTYDNPANVRDVFIAHNLKTDFDIVNNTIVVSILGPLHQDNNKMAEHSTPKHDSNEPTFDEIAAELIPEAQKIPHAIFNAPKNPENSFYKINSKKQDERPGSTTQVQAYLSQQNHNKAINTGLTTAVFMALAFSVLNWTVFNIPFYIYSLAMAFGISYQMRKKGQMLDVKYGFTAAKYFLIATYAVYASSVVRFLVNDLLNFNEFLYSFTFGILNDGNWGALIIGSLISVFNAYRTVPKDIREEVMRLNKELQKRDMVYNTGKGIISKSNSSSKKQNSADHKIANNVVLPKYLHGESKEIDARKKSRRDDYQKIKNKHRDEENERMDTNRFNKSGKEIKF